MTFDINDRVRVQRHHWARGGEVGTVIESEDQNKCVVEFDHKGIGYDGGMRLRLDELDLEVEDAPRNNNDSRRVPTRRITLA